MEPNIKSADPATITEQRMEDDAYFNDLDESRRKLAYVFGAIALIIALLLYFSDVKPSHDQDPPRKAGLRFLTFSRKRKCDAISTDFIFVLLTPLINS